MLRRRTLFGLIRRHFVGFRKSRLTTITDLMMGLMTGGRLGLAAIARGMRDSTTVRHRIKRLWRFVQNPGVRAEEASEALVRWLAPKGAAELVVSLDWTHLPDYHMLCASCGVRRRAVPLAWVVVTTAQFSSKKNKSRNEIEERLIQRLVELMAGRTWVLVADRGFARADLFAKLQAWQVPYVIRACGNVWVGATRYSGLLDNLPRRPRRVVRWSKVRYQKKRCVPVSLVMTHEEPAAEPWYLVTNLEGYSRVVNIYRRRMGIEESFRDAKSVLGLEKIWLARSERLERLLILAALCMLMAVLVALETETRLGTHDLQLTTKRKGRTLSLFKTGLHLVQTSGLPPGLSRLHVLPLADAP